MKTPVTLAIVLLLTLGLGACGFQPRGELPTLDTLSPLQLQGLDRFDPLYPELTRALQQAGITLAEGKDVNRLVISERTQDREVLTTDIHNRAVEYQLGETLRYQLIKKDGQQAGEPRQVRVERILYDPGTRLLAKRNEEQTIRAEMRQALIRQLIRQLAATP